MQTQHTHTVRACFHLGLCVLLHFSVLFDWPSTVTSTYGLGPNQFFLFSFSLAERTKAEFFFFFNNTNKLNYMQCLIWSITACQKIWYNLLKICFQKTNNYIWHPPIPDANTGSDSNSLLLIGEIVLTQEFRNT